MKVAIIGTSQLGVANAINLGGKRRLDEIILIGMNAESASAAQESRCHPSHFREVKIPGNVLVTTDYSALYGADVVFIDVNASRIRGAMKAAQNYLKKGVIIVSDVKGFEPGTTNLPLEVVAQELAGKDYVPAARSGWMQARNLVHGNEKSLVDIASPDYSAALLVENLVDGDGFAITASTDYVGVQLSGIMKNVYVFLLGIQQGKRKLGTYIDSRIMQCAAYVFSEAALAGVWLGGDERTFGRGSSFRIDVLKSLCSDTINARFGRMYGRGLSIPYALERLWVESGRIPESYVSAHPLKARAMDEGLLRLPFAEAAILAVSWNA